MEAQQQLLDRREARRLRRQEEHSSPVRWRVSLPAVILVLLGLGTIVVITWFGTLGQGEEELPGEVALPREPSAEPSEGEGAADTINSDDDKSSSSGDPPEAAEAVVVVHVVGEVEEPQVVELAEGSRIADAVEAAGGLTEQAAIEGINLAALLTDGALIQVPSEEQWQQQLEAGQGQPSGGDATDHPAGADNGDSSEGSTPVNINTADAEELQQLAGIGPALAQRVISYREEHGDFGSAEELAAVSGIGPAVLESIVDEVTW